MSVLHTHMNTYFFTGKTNTSDDASIPVSLDRRNFPLKFSLYKIQAMLLMDKCCVKWIDEEGLVLWHINHCR